MNLVSPEIHNYCLKRSSKPSALLQELWDYTHAHTDAPQMLTGPIEGNFLRMLVGIHQPKRILEIGTFTGYSALWMAENLPKDGTIVTVDVSQNNLAIAKEFFAKSPYQKQIQIEEGPALRVMAKMIENQVEPFDMVFVDADKQNYTRYFQKCMELTKPRALMVFDNTLWSGRVLMEDQDEETQGIDRLNIMLEHDLRVQNVLLSVRDGIQLVQRVQ